MSLPTFGVIHTPAKTQLVEVCLYDATKSGVFSGCNQKTHVDLAAETEYKPEAMRQAVGYDFLGLSLLSTTSPRNSKGLSVRAQSVGENHTTIPPRGRVSSGTTELSNSLNSYLTPREIMRELRLSADTVYGLIKRGEIPSIRTGARSIRIRREAFEEWCHQQESGNLARAGEKART